MVNNCELPPEMWSYIIKNLPEKDQVSTFCTSHLLKKVTLMAKIEIYREKLKDPNLDIVLGSNYHIRLAKCQQKLGIKQSENEKLKTDRALQFIEITTMMSDLMKLYNEH